jgi:hypothetical protein
MGLLAAVAGELGSPVGTNGEQPRQQSPPPQSPPPQQQADTLGMLAIVASEQHGTPPPSQGCITSAASSGSPGMRAAGLRAVRIALPLPVAEPVAEPDMQTLTALMTTLAPEPEPASDAGRAAEQQGTLRPDRPLDIEAHLASLGYKENRAREVALVLARLGFREVHELEALGAMGETDRRLFVEHARGEGAQVGMLFPLLAKLSESSSSQHA